eukprot:IDg17793t1
MGYSNLSKVYGCCRSVSKIHVRAFKTGSRSFFMILRIAMRKTEASPVGMERLESWTIYFRICSRHERTAMLRRLAMRGSERNRRKNIAVRNAMVLNALLGKDRKKTDSLDEERMAKKRRVEVGDGMP